MRAIFRVCAHGALQNKQLSSTVLAARCKLCQSCLTVTTTAMLGDMQGSGGKREKARPEGPSHGLRQVKPCPESMQPHYIHELLFGGGPATEAAPDEGQPTKQSGAPKSVPPCPGPALAPGGTPRGRKGASRSPSSPKIGPQPPQPIPWVTTRSPTGQRTRPGALWGARRTGAAVRTATGPAHLRARRHAAGHTLLPRGAGGASQGSAPSIRTARAAAHHCQRD